MIIVALLTSREVTKAHQKDSVSAHFHDKNSCQLYRLWLIRWCIMRCITLDLDYQSALTSCPYSIVETHGHCSMPSSTPHMRSLRYTAASTILFTAGRPTDSFPNAYHGILEGIVYVRFASRLIHLPSAHMLHCRTHLFSQRCICGYDVYSVMSACPSRAQPLCAALKTCLGLPA